MSLKVKISKTLYCPRHRGFDPRRGGESAIRGGCRVCYALLEFLNQVRVFEEKLVEAEKMKKG